MDVTAQFAAHRGMLFALAYRMLGSVADAEDVLQETWLRWSAADRSAVREPRAYLARTVSRLALNQLRARRTRREVYVGPWLPEPLPAGADLDGAPDAADEVLLGESVSMALLVVLETLGPAERVVFVLREVFGYGYDEVADALGRPVATVRQIAHRAREHVRARRPRFDADRDAQRQATERFLRASTGGDLTDLLELLAPDVTLWADSGGAVKAPPRPIVGAATVARFWTLVVVPNLTGQQVRTVELNGRTAAVSFRDGRPTGMLGLELTDGRVSRLWVLVNPDKLRRLRLPTGADAGV